MLRLLGYYIPHTFVNVIKKVFRTWIAIFLVIFLVSGLFGGLLGLSLGILLDDGEEPSEGPTDTVPPDSSALPGDAVVDPENPSEGEDEDEGGLFGVLNLDQKTQASLFAAGALVITLIVLGFEVLSSEHGKQQLFSMPDVNFLFASPARPQNVLTFRTLMILGRYIFLALYLGLCFGMSLPPVWLGAGVLSLMMLFLLAECLSVLAYGLVNTHDRLRRFVRPVGYGLIALAPLICFIVYSTAGGDLLTIAGAIGANRYLRLIPIAGWISGVGYSFMTGDWLNFVICLAVCLIAVAGLVLLIHRLRLDYYESGIANATKTQELIEAQKQRRSVRTRKKDRSEKVHRDVIRHGRGAKVFFFKSVALTHRNAAFGFLTPSLGIWLAVSMLIFFLTKVVSKSSETLPLTAVYLFGLMMLSFGNPISEEMEKNFIWLAPESSFRKLVSAFAGAQYGQLLGFLPAYLLGAILIGGSLLTVVASTLFLLAFSFFCSASGLLTGLIVPTSMPETIRTMIQMVIKLFSLIPTMAVIVVCLILEALPLGCLIATVMNFALAAGCIGLSLIPVSRGRS